MLSKRTINSIVRRAIAAHAQQPTQCSLVGTQYPIRLVHAENPESTVDLTLSIDGWVARRGGRYYVARLLEESGEVVDLGQERVTFEYHTRQHPTLLAGQSIRLCPDGQAWHATLR